MSKLIEILTDRELIDAYDKYNNVGRTMEVSEALNELRNEIRSRVVFAEIIGIVRDRTFARERRELGR